MITCLAVRDGRVESFELADLGRVLADRKTRVWVDFENEGAEVFEAMRPTLGFHPLVIEDCVQDVNRPKVDDYSQYLYLAVHSARWDDPGAEPILKELDLIIGERYLISFHDDPTRSVTHAREHLTRRPDLLGRGPDHLLHFLLDVMVDNYLPIMDTLDDRLDILGESLFRSPTQRVLADILRLKRGMASLRRIVGPQRDTILALTRNEFTAVRAELRPYLRDVFDRMVRVSDQLDLFREELASLLEIYSTQVSNRLNEVLKVLTVITVIIMPVNLVASIYGMNFENMPELEWRWGYAFALGLMAVVAGAMLWWIRKRRWL